ncbi:hypothetical protein [Aeromicrobium erythreum]|uniref:hypothetical protein n=1 Tax=Aeromicrobium erythreum TaxID=2041 RepID=UPI0011877334|nr:hypothetical protein [Aeromicrobium erythreum]
MNHVADREVLDEACKLGGERDGMGPELMLADGEVIAEVFEPEATGERTVTLFRPELPLETLLWFLVRVDTEL